MLAFETEYSVMLWVIDDYLAFAERSSWGKLGELRPWLVQHLTSVVLKGQLQFIEPRSLNTAENTYHLNILSILDCSIFDGPIPTNFTISPLNSL